MRQKADWMGRLVPETKWGVAVCLAIPPVVWLTLAALDGCGVSPAAHAANVAEGVQQQAELTECRAKAREAKKDGGAEAYMAVYEDCATRSDIKHGLKEGGP